MLVYLSSDLISTLIPWPWVHPQPDLPGHLCSLCHMSCPTPSIQSRWTSRVDSMGLFFAHWIQQEQGEQKADNRSNVDYMLSQRMCGSKKKLAGLGACFWLLIGKMIAGSGGMNKIWSQAASFYVGPAGQKLSKFWLGLGKNFAEVLTSIRFRLAKRVVHCDLQSNGWFYKSQTSASGCISAALPSGLGLLMLRWEFTPCKKDQNWKSKPM